MIGQVLESCGIVFGMIGAFAVIPAWFFNRGK